MKTLIEGKSARAGFRRGVGRCEDVIRPTLGSNGSNVLIGREGMTPLVTNDGATIALEMELDDDLENEGCLRVKELTQTASVRIRGGTTTATVLYRAILDEAMDRIDASSSLRGSGKGVIDAKKDIAEWCAKACDAVMAKCRRITDDEVYDVALTAGEFKWIADICRDVFSKVGRRGDVRVIDGVTTGYDAYTGMELRAGLPSPAFGGPDGKCVLDGPTVIVSDSKATIQTHREMVKDSLRDGSDSIVLIAPDFDAALLAEFEESRRNAGVSCVAVRIPSYGKTDLFDDVRSFLGESRKIDRAIISEKSTFLMGGRGDTKSRVEQLERLKAETESAFDIERLEHRIGSLSGGVAVIRVAADSEVERSYYRKKMDDAVNASQSALMHGVVRGGGLALKEASDELGECILSRALRAPYDAIQESLGGNADIPESVIDSARMTVEVLKLACSTASTDMTIGNVVLIRRKKDDKREV